MHRAIVDSGHELTSPWVLGSGEGKGGDRVNVFSRDKTAVELSEAIVADVSAPSTGVGMEIMAARQHGKRIILAMQKGSVVSRMLLQMDRKEVLEFTDDRDLYAGLRRLLETGKGSERRESV